MTNCQFAKFSLSPNFVIIQYVVTVLFTLIYIYIYICERFK